MKKRNAFTLIELLVVISIIALLAGLAVPAINGALKSAQQTAEVSNIRNLGVILFAEATDNNGSYPDENLVLVIQDLASSNILTDGKVLTAAGYDEVTIITPTTAGGTSTINGQIGFGYAGDGMTTAADDRFVLLCSRGYNGTNAAAAQVTLSAQALSWQADGLTIYYKGNNASFNKSGNGIDTTGAEIESGSAKFGGGRTDLAPNVVDPSQ
ncbi:MAG: type II secretion system protein [Verrucomicrobiota bacterium]